MANKEIEKLIETKEKDIKRLGRDRDEKEDYDLKGARTMQRPDPLCHLTNVEPDSLTGRVVDARWGTATGQAHCYLVSETI